MMSAESRLLRCSFASRFSSSSSSYDSSRKFLSSLDMDLLDWIALHGAEFTRTDRLRDVPSPTPIKSRDGGYQEFLWGGGKCGRANAEGQVWKGRCGRAGMTGKCGAGAPARVGRQISQFPNKTKKATPLAQRGLWFYAGDDLISHTLSRVV